LCQRNFDFLFFLSCYCLPRGSVCFEQQTVSVNGAPSASSGHKAGALLKAVSAPAGGVRKPRRGLRAPKPGRIKLPRAQVQRWGDDCVALSVRSDDGQFQLPALCTQLRERRLDRQRQQQEGCLSASADILLGTIWPTWRSRTRAYLVRAHRRHSNGCLYPPRYTRWCYFHPSPTMLRCAGEVRRFVPKEF